MVVIMWHTTWYRQYPTFNELLKEVTVWNSVFQMPKEIWESFFWTKQFIQLASLFWHQANNAFEKEQKQPLKAKHHTWFRASKLLRGLYFRSNGFFLHFLHGCISCERNGKELTYKKWSPQPSVEAGRGAQLLQGQASVLGSPDLRPLPPSASWKCLVLPGGPFPFEDWCLEERSGKPPTPRLSLCSGPDHPEICLEKYYTSSEVCSSETSPGYTAKLTARPGEESEEDQLGQSLPNQTECHIMLNPFLCSPVFSSITRWIFSSLW